MVIALERIYLTTTFLSFKYIVLKGLISFTFNPVNVPCIQGWKKNTDLFDEEIQTQKLPLKQKIYSVLVLLISSNNAVRAVYKHQILFSQQTRNI